MALVTDVPPERVRRLNRASLRRDGDYVLYWMVAQRRLEWNFALDHAVALASQLHLPLVILEGLRVAYPWASHRHHAFALAGMAEHQARLAHGPGAYLPYVEPTAGAGRGLLEALAARAAVVVTDDTPAFFLPRMVAAAAERLSAPVDAVDGNGLLPLSVTPEPFSTAVAFRRFLQKVLPDHLLHLPSPAPLDGVGLPPAALPAEVTERWQPASPALLARGPEALGALPVDASVPPSPIPGGSRAARARLDAFLADGLHRYGEERNHPDAHASSGLSPYLHWGHLSVHHVVRALMDQEGWSPARLGTGASGKRHGWWGMSPSAEAFLDELVTWRELGFVYCHHQPDYHLYDTLPAWALDTLEAHAADPRPWRYTLDELAGARTHDALWNAAQRELRDHGVMHNYLRMLWGKKILEWTAHPRDALDVMVELNNRFALDGRDPNSYTGIFWVLGRFDRGWPERPVFGKVRCMTSDSTRRKLKLDAYLARWGEEPPGPAPRSPNPPEPCA